MFSNDWVGRKIIFEDSSYAGNIFYPPVGTIGEVLNYEKEDDTIFVQWPEGQTEGDGRWWIFPNQKVRLLNDEIKDFSDEEIFEMLKPKMDKNGLKKYNDYEISLISRMYGREIEYYEEESVQKAIATAYRVGYLRAKKGRPFKYNHKK